MATIDCEISDKSDTNSKSRCKNELNNTTNLTNVDTENCQSDSCHNDTDIALKDVKPENGQVIIDKQEKVTENNISTISSDLLAIPLPKYGHRMSLMEEESAKEKLRLTLLKQCSAILKQGDQWYTKESLHRTFQDQVSLHSFNQI